MRGKDVYPLLKRTVDEWIDDLAPTYAASVAYYTVFSLSPLLIIAVGVAGVFFGEEAARGEIDSQLRDLIGEAGAQAVQQMMVNAKYSDAGTLATIAGLAILAFGATAVFVQLQEALNHIWNVQSPKVSGFRNFLRIRFWSFAMVIGTGFLLLVSLVMSALLSAFGKYLGHLIPGWSLMLQLLDFFVPWALITVLFAISFKVIPDRKIAWRDVWLGAGVTSLLFSIGKFAIGLYLGKSSVASSYGAAASLAIILIWVYYSAQIFFLGAEFTQVYARCHGSLRNSTCD